MREESQLDEMRSAIRGDFERLAERRGEQELMRVVEGETSPAPVDVVLEEPPPGPAERLSPMPVEVEPETTPEEVEEEVAPQRSWLARFFAP